MSQGSSTPVPSSTTDDSPPSPRQQSSPQDDAPAQRAYLLEWEWDSLRQGYQSCRRTPLSTPAAVRAAVEVNAVSRGADEDKTAVGDGGKPTRKLLVLNGLYRGFVDALLASDLGMDPAFIECCAARRPYCPATSLKQRARRRRMRDGKGRLDDPGDERSGSMWEYPELVEGMEGTVRSGEFGTAVPVSSFAERDDDDERKTAVIFYRAALWQGSTASVLLLENPLWGGSKEQLRRVRRKMLYAGGEGDGANLQDVLLTALLKGSWDPDDDLTDVLSEAVYDRWLDVLDLLEPRPKDLLLQTLASYLQMMRSLEFNEEREGGPHWTRLLARVQRRIELSTPREKLSFAPPVKTPTTTPRRTMTSRTDTINPSLKTELSRRAGDPKQPGDENQRALDRLSYLGGILIPLPIVSGILSMGDTYGPDGGKFYVFWAVAVPLALLAVMIIYADTIRKAEVWVEIQADRVMPTPEDKSGTTTTTTTTTAAAAETTTIRPIDVEVKQTVTWQRQQQQRAENGGTPSPAMVYSIDHDVEEQFIGMPRTASAPLAAPQQTADEEVRDAVIDWLPLRTRSTGVLQAPPMILERPEDGSKPKAWKREQLGWTGALQAMFYKKYRHGSDVPEGVAACEKPGRRKTNSY